MMRGMRPLKVHIDMKQPVVVRCECGLESAVADLEAGIHWAFLEGLRHGAGCSLDIAIDMTWHVEVSHAAAQPSHPG